ncbi:pyocin knob domain-containing protein [Ligilactobacillus sp. LYQ135]
MKKLTLLNDDTNVKLGDTGTLIQFKASINDTPVFLKEGQTANFRIKNDLGFLKSIDANTTMNGYVFEFDTSKLDGLVPGTYQLELAVSRTADDVDIFPDRGFVQFAITENALSVTGEQLPVMSLEAFKKEVNSYVSTKVDETKKDITDNFQIYVDGITDSTTDIANKASQDATNAIGVANQSNAKAQQALDISDNLNDKVAANTTQISDLSNKLIPIYNNQTNVLVNSELKNFNSWVHGSSVILSNETYNNNGVIQLTPGTSSNYLAQDVKGIDSTKGYTFYVYAKGSTNSKLHIEFRAGSKTDINLTSNWQLMTFSGKFADPSYTRLYLWNSGTRDNIYISTPKLTQWCMTFDMYNKLVNATSSINLLKDQMGQLTIQLAQSQMAQAAQSNTDLNTLTSDGKWSFNNTTVSNAPGGAKTLTGTLEVTNNGTSGVQTVVDAVADIMFWRTWNGSNFNKWHAVANDSSIISPA